MDDEHRHDADSDIDGEPPRAAAPDDDAIQATGTPEVSLAELRDAFSEMLAPVDPSEPAADATETGEPGSADLTPRSIVEAILFVGNEDSIPISGERVASIIPGVEPEEVDQIVEGLNREYTAAGNPYEIIGTAAGYRLVLRDQFRRTRDRFYGRVRQARLSQAAVEVLALVAYSQPLSADQVTKLRGKPSGPVLAQLVRRQLLAIERPADKPKKKHYRTTQRFLDLFGLESLDHLPQSRELDMS